MTIMYHLSIYTRQNRQQLEQKRAEAASLIAEREQLLLRQNARLEEEVCLRTAELIAANKTKDRLFSIISHDFRSPIATLKGSLNLLQRDILSPADFVKLTQNLASSTDRLYNNLDTMLQWALSQLGEITTRPTIVNAHELADEAIDIMQDAANRKGISLLNSVKCDMLIKADEYQLITIFRNLLDNAIKFTPVKGRVEVGGYPDATWGLVFVRDTGVGTAPTTIGELLNSGISTVGTAGEKGLGLGLRLCNELLSKNGGYLSIHSELGAGTTIECRLPLGIMSSSIDAL
ncbi:sensor histidine kinase [Spirosoma montaniterrae]|nr:HAMP domain-containing sensor histidine kinase [Spirosoma montaniterrae]